MKNKTISLFILILCTGIVLCSFCARADRRAQLSQARAPVVSSFDFNSITNLALWLEARGAVSVNSPIQNTDTITAITNFAIGGIPVGPFNTPKFISSGGGNNNASYIVATNAAGFGDSGTNLFTTNRFTAVFVLRIDRGGGGSGGGIYGRSGNINEASFDYSTNTMVYDLYNGVHLQTPGSTLITNRWHVLTTLVDGASSLIRTNGATAVTGDAGTGGGMLSPWKVCRTSFVSDLEFMNGAVLRILFWARPLSPTEYQQVETQCRLDFGI